MPNHKTLPAPPPRTAAAPRCRHPTAAPPRNLPLFFPLTLPSLPPSHTRTHAQHHSQSHPLTPPTHPHPHPQIKHGRVCMLAFVGTCFAANGVVFPGDLGGFHYEACAWYDGLASGLNTNSFGMAQLLMTIGLIEVRSLLQTTCRPTPTARCRHCRPWTELRKASPQRHDASHVPASTF